MAFDLHATALKKSKKNIICHPGTHLILQLHFKWLFSHGFWIASFSSVINQNGVCFLEIIKLEILRRHTILTITCSRHKGIEVK